MKPDSITLDFTRFKNSEELSCFLADIQSHDIKKITIEKCAVRESFEPLYNELIKLKERQRSEVDIQIQRWLIDNDQKLYGLERVFIDWLDKQRLTYTIEFPKPSHKNKWLRSAAHQAFEQIKKSEAETSDSYAARLATAENLYNKLSKQEPIIYGKESIPFTEEWENFFRLCKFSPVHFLSLFLIHSAHNIRLLQYPLYSACETISARNHLLNHFGSTAQTNLWQSAVEAFAIKHIAIRNLKNGDNIDFAWYSRAQDRDFFYEYSSPLNSSLKKLGVNFFQAYLDYLNGRQDYYQSTSFPYTTLNLAQQPATEIVSNEFLVCLSTYLSNKNNFFPFTTIKLVFGMETQETMTVIKKLLLQASKRQLEKIEIRHFHFNDEQTIELITFIKEQHITTVLSTRVYETAIENAIMENRRQLFKDELRLDQRREQPSQTTVQKRAVIGGEMHWRQSFHLPKDTQDLNIDIEQVHAQFHEVQQEVAVNIEINREENSQIDLDYDQEVTEAPSTLIDTEEAFSKIINQYHPKRYGLAHRLWQVLFASNRPYSLSGLMPFAAEAMIKFHETFEDDLNPNNLPDGFYIRRFGEKYFLTYNEFCPREKPKTPLTPALINVSSFCHDERAVSNLHGDVSQFISNDRRCWQSFLREMDKNTTIAKNLFEQLCSNKEVSQHTMLLYLFRGRKYLSVTTLNEQLIALLIAQGPNGILELLNFLSFIKETWGSNCTKDFVRAFFLPAEGYKPDLRFFNTQKARDSIEKLKTLTKHEAKGWFKMVHHKRFTRNVPRILTYEVDAFCYFVEQFKTLCSGKELGNNFPYDKLTSVVQLDFYLEILKHSKNRDQQLRTINDLEDYGEAYYAMCHKGYHFVSKEMAYNYYSSVELEHLLCPERKHHFDEPDKILGLCYLGSHQMALSYDKFIELYQARLFAHRKRWKQGEYDNNQLEQEMHLILAYCSLVSMKDGVADIDRVVEEIDHFTIKQRKITASILTQWCTLGRRYPTDTALKLLLSWVCEDHTNEDIETLKQRGANYLVGLEENDAQQKSYYELIKLISDYHPALAQAVAKAAIPNEQLLRIWANVKSVLTESSVKEQTNYFCQLLLANSTISPTHACRLLALFKKHKAAFLPLSLSVVMKLLAGYDQDIPEPLFQILCHYAETNALPVDAFQKENFTEYLLQKGQQLPGLKRLLDQGITPSPTRIQETGLTQLEALELDPHGKTEWHLTWSEDKKHLEKAFDSEMFKSNKQIITRYRCYSRALHYFQETTPIQVAGISKIVKEMTYEDTQKVIKNLTGSIHAETNPEKKVFLMLQYLAVMRAVMYRTTGIMPNCTQMLSCLHVLEASNSQILRIESNEGKSAISAMHASLQLLAGRTPTVVSASATLSKRDCYEFKNFYRCMNGVEATYLTATSKPESYQPGGIHYAEFGNFQLFKGHVWFNGYYESHQRVLIADEVHEIVLPYHLQYRNVRPAGGGDRLSQHPVAELFNMVNEFIDNNYNRNKTINDFINYLYERGNDHVRRYLDLNYKELSDWQLMLSAACSAQNLKENEHFLIREEFRQEGTTCIKQKVARPLTKNNDTVSKQGRYTNVQEFLHARLQTIYGPDIRFPIEQEMDCFSTLTGSTLWKDYAMQDGAIAFGLTATPGSEAQQRELMTRYPGTTFTPFPAHFKSKRYDYHPDKPLIIEPDATGDDMMAKQANAILNCIDNLEDPEQPVFIVCETIEDAEKLYATVCNTFSNRPIQLSHSGSTEEWLDGQSHPVKMKDQNVINNAGRARQITITTPKFKVGTNVKSQANDDGVSVIVAYIPTEIDHEQIKRRTARGRQGGKNYWIPLHGGDVEKIRSKLYEKESKLREQYDQLATIKYEKFRSIASQLSHLRKHQDELYNALQTLQEAIENITRKRPESPVDELQEQAKNIQIAFHQNAQHIKAIQDSWVNFLHSIETAWMLDKIFGKGNIEEFHTRVNEQFTQQFKDLPLLSVLREVTHPSILQPIKMFALSKKHAYNSDIIFCTLKAHEKETEAYQTCYERAVNSLCTKLNTLALESITEQMAFTAHSLTPNSLQFIDNLLEPGQLEAKRWMHHHQPDQNNQVLNENLKQNLIALLDDYRKQSLVAIYRKNEAIDLSEKLKEAMTPLALLKAINDSSFKTFQEDENYNHNSLFFKRNRRFSRYQVLLESMRDLVIASLPNTQIQEALAADFQHLGAICTELDPNSPALLGKPSWLDSIKNRFSDPTHFMTNIIRKHCEFLGRYMAELQVEEIAVPELFHDVRANCDAH